MNKEKYREHCQEESSIPLFSRDWWLDVVCGEENWDIALVEKGGHIIGTMPYFIKKRVGLTILTQPHLTQTLGPWIRPSESKYAKTLGYQKKVMEALIKQIPKFDYFTQNWHYNSKNWLPFYWNGFTQTTKYTYVLDDLTDSAKLWAGLESNIRGDIRKAQNRFHLEARADCKIDDFLEVNRMTFKRQNIPMPYSGEFVKKLDAECSKRKCRKVWMATDKNGRHHACAYIVWDENSAYYLMGGGNPDLRNSGANSLLMWEAIKHASSVTRKFDFEGSMLESVERFFHCFGAKQIPYHNICKINSKLIQIHQCMSRIVKAKGIVKS